MVSSTVTVLRRRSISVEMLPTEKNTYTPKKPTSFYTVSMTAINKVRKNQNATLLLRIVNRHFGRGRQSLQKVLPLQEELQAGGKGVKGNYILVIKIVYEIASYLLISPFYLRYDRSSNLYKIQPCHIIQRASCLVFAFLSGLSAFNIIYAMGMNAISNRGNIGVYFDFLNGIILQVYFYTTCYFVWCRKHLFARLIHILQTSPLLLYSTLPLWKAILLPTFCWILTIYMSVIWSIMVLGLKFTGNFEDSLAGMAGQVFYLNGGEGQLVTGFLGVVAIVSKWYNGLYNHVSFTLFAPTFLFSIHLVTQDFFRYGLPESLEVEDVELVVELYQNYKDFIDAANCLSGPLNVHFIMMMLTYHSIHLFDALNDPNTLWKINTYLYLMILVNFLTTPSKSLLLNRKIKTWLWKDYNYRIITSQELSIILDDYSSKRLGVKGGSLFTISPRFSGLVLQHLLSYAMLIAIHGKRTAVSN